jgi:hypothetical protein
MDLVEPPSGAPADDADSDRTGPPVGGPAPGAAGPAPVAGPAPGAAGPAPDAAGPIPDGPATPDPGRLPVPAPVAAALVLLVLCAGVSAGFVIQRGGIALPATTATPSPLATAAPSPAEPPVSSASPATPVPSLPSPVVSSTEAPPRASITPSAVPSPVPSPSIGSRVSLLTPCPDAPDCYVYVVGRNDVLIGIANYFGVQLATIYEMNPRYAQGAVLRAGDRLRLPPPTR